jgi:hypothetical protein
MAGKKKKTTPPRNPNEKRRKNDMPPDESDNDSSEEESTDEILKEIRETQKFIVARFDSFEKTVGDLLAENKNLHENITKLQQSSNKQEKQIELITSELNFCKQKLLEKDVIITGVPNLTNMKPEIVLEKIDAVVGFGMSNIDQWYVMTGTSRITKKPYTNICVKFTSYQAKQKVIANQSENGPILWSQLFENLNLSLAQNKIIVIERLTPDNLTILNAARRLRDGGALTYVWHKNGIIWSKITADGRAEKVRSLSDLQKYNKNV